MKDYPIHPAAKLFPMLGPTELGRLAESIRAHGLLHPITRHEGQILDGRNRFIACGMANVEPRWQDFDTEAGVSPTEWVLATNSERRHLSIGELTAAAVAALPMIEAEAKERQRLNAIAHNTGVPNREIIPYSEEKGKSSEIAAKAVGVNPRYVSDAKKIKEQAPEIFEQLKSGQLTLPEAKRKMERIQNPPTEREEFYMRGCPDPETTMEGKEDSIHLSETKRHWRKLTKKEKDQFQEWVNANKNK